MTWRTRAKVALSKRLPSGQEAEHRGPGPGARTTITSSRPSSGWISRRVSTSDPICPKLAIRTWVAFLLLRRPSRVISEAEHSCA
jgi:hypothetical protein